jgi:hypothetical protein
VREAHAIDSRSPMARLLVEDPVTTDERQIIANNCVSKLNLPMRAVLDRIDDKTGVAYSAWPDRLFLVGQDGKIAYAGGRGPFGFKPDELEDAIIEEMNRVWEASKKSKKAKGR